MQKQARITSKGQITVPRELHESYRPGDIHEGGNCLPASELVDGRSHIDSALQPGCRFNMEPELCADSELIRND